MKTSTATFTTVKGVTGSAKTGAAADASGLRIDSGFELVSRISDPGVERDRNLNQLSQNQTTAQKDAGFFGNLSKSELADATNNRIAQREAELNRKLSDNEKIAIIGALKQLNNQPVFFNKPAGPDGAVKPAVNQDFIDGLQPGAIFERGLQGTAEVFQDAGNAVVDTTKKLTSPLGLTTIAAVAIAGIVLLRKV